MWFADQPIAHRGLHGDGLPENTLAAFDAAAAAGYAIELDVHQSADGEVVVFHDERLDRLTLERGPLAQRSWSQLRTVRIAGSDETMPCLDDVLRLVGSRAPLLIEIKNEGTVGRVEAAVAERLDGFRGDAAVQSFNPLSMVWFRRHRPHLHRGMLASDFKGTQLPAYKKLLLRHLLFAGAVAPSFVGYDISCLPYFAPALLRRVGVPVVAWTVRTAEELARSTRTADNVIFEHLRPAL